MPGHTAAPAREGTWKRLRTTYKERAEDVLCPACGKWLRPTHWCDPEDHTRLVAHQDPDLRHEYERGMVALLIAQDVAAYDALLRGEKVHPSQLDMEAVTRLRAEGVQL